MFIISEKANVWFSTFPYFKVNFWSEFSMRSAIEKARSIAQCLVSYNEQCEYTANSMPFCTLKSGNLENQTFALSLIMNIWLSSPPLQ